MNKQIIVLFLSLTLTYSCSKYSLNDIQSKEEVISSQITHDNYPLYYFIPVDYNDEKQYPVIYLLDGDWHADRVAAELSQLWKDNIIPKCILVGIGNSDERIRDYTYPADEYNKGSGHADRYYEFLHNELLPHVDSAYSIDTTQRIIAGHSLGGFLVLYAMLRDKSSSKSFSGIIALSPSIWWQDAHILGMEETYSETENDLPVQLFLSAGSDEGVTNMLNTEMRERLENREYPSFRTYQVNIKDKGHEGALIPGFLEGIKFIFN